MVRDVYYLYVFVCYRFMRRSLNALLVTYPSWFTCPLGRRVWIPSIVTYHLKWFLGDMLCNGCYKLVSCVYLKILLVIITMGHLRAVDTHIEDRASPEPPICWYVYLYQIVVGISRRFILILPNNPGKYLWIVHLSNPSYLTTSIPLYISPLYHTVIQLQNSVYEYVQNSVRVSQLRDTM